MNKQYFSYLIRNYHNKGLVIDTNLFILYLIGKYDKTIISKFKRTVEYSSEDFDILKRFVDPFRRVITTPNIITEVTNIVESLNRSEEYRLFKFLHKSLMSLREEYIASLKVTQTTCFEKFGLTDSTIFFLAKNGLLILTADMPFYHYLVSQKMPAINFNHLRSGKWLR